MKIRRNGLDIAFSVAGAGRPVVLVHGFPLSGALWAEVVPLLARDHLVVVPDLRGFGSSDAAASASMGEYAADVLACLDAVAPGAPAAFAGMSMGGYVVLDVARKEPARVERLVLTNTRATADTPEQRRGRADLSREVIASGPGRMAAAFRTALFAPTAPAAIAAVWEARMAAADRVGLAAALGAMAERSDASSILEGYDRPALVVAGDLDGVTPVDEAKRMACLLPNGRLEVIPGTGHMTVVEAPAAWAALVSSFLGRG